MNNARTLRIQACLVLFALFAQFSAAGFVEVCEWKNCAAAPVSASYDSLWGEGEASSGAGIPAYWEKMEWIHSKHPLLKVTATFTPKNESFSGDKSRTSILSAPESVRQWARGVQKMQWMEIADHGLTHKNPMQLAGEFDAYQNPDATNSAWCGARILEIRDIFSELGLDNSKIYGFRGPAYMWTDCIADALAENGFRYILVKRNYGNFLRPRMMKVAEGKFYADIFDPYPLYYATAGGRSIILVPTTIYPASSEDPQYLEYLITGHAVLNFFFHSDDMLDAKTLSDWDKTLAYLEKFNLWWASTGEVADYWDERQNTAVSESLNGNELRINVGIKKAAEGTQLSLLLRTKTPVESAVFRGERIVPEESGAGIVLTHDFGSGGELVVGFEGVPKPFESGARAADAARASELLGAMQAEKDAVQNLNMLEFALIEAGLVAASALFLALGRRAGKPRSWKVVLVSFALVQPVLIVLSASYLGILQPSVFATGVSPVEEAFIYAQHLEFSPVAMNVQPLPVIALFAWYAAQCVIASFAFSRVRKLRISGQGA